MSNFAMLFFILLFGLLGCSDTEMSSNISKTLGNSSTSTGRPSEDGEGVPGYLTDPNLVSVDQRLDLETQIDINGVSGAISTLPEYSAKNVHISIISVDALEFEKAVIKNYSKITGTRIGHRNANGDGSFTVQVKMEVGKIFILSIGSDSGSVYLPKESDQLTAVFFNPAETDPEFKPLIWQSVKIIEGEQSSSVPSVDNVDPIEKPILPMTEFQVYLNERNACNDRGLYFDSDMHCTDDSIMRIPNCIQPRNNREFLKLFDQSAGYFGKNSDYSRMESLINNGYSIDQCFGTFLMISGYITFYKEDSNILIFENVSVPYFSLKELEN